MPDEKGARGILRELGSELRGQLKKIVAAKIVLGGGVVLAAIAGGLAKWLKNASDVERGILWGVAITLASLVLLVTLAAVWRYLRRKPPEPLPAEPKAPPGSVNRLNEVMGICGHAFDYVVEYFDGDLFGAPKNEDQALVYDLVVRLSLRPYGEQLYTLRARLSAAVELSATEKQFDEIKSLFFVVLKMYESNASYLIRMSRSLMGQERALRSEGVEKLRRRHDDLVKEVRRLKDWPDLRGIARSVGDLASLFPRTPEFPTPTTDHTQNPA